EGIVAPTPAVCARQAFLAAIAASLSVIATVSDMAGSPACSLRSPRIGRDLPTRFYNRPGDRHRPFAVTIWLEMTAISGRPFIRFGEGDRFDEVTWRDRSGQQP